MPSQSVLEVSGRTSSFDEHTGTKRLIKLHIAAMPHALLLRCECLSSPASVSATECMFLQADMPIWRDCLLPACQPLAWAWQDGSAGGTDRQAREA